MLAVCWLRIASWELRAKPDSNAQTDLEPMTRLSRLLVKLAKLHRERVADRLRPLDVHIGQDLVLMVLLEDGPMNQKTLAGALDVEQATITAVAGNLREKGLVARESLPGDGRVSILRLTEQGHERAQDVSEIWSSLENRLLEGFANSERKSVAAVLKRMIDNLDT